MRKKRSSYGPEVHVSEQGALKVLEDELKQAKKTSKQVEMSFKKFLPEYRAFNPRDFIEKTKKEFTVAELNELKSLEKEMNKVKGLKASPLSFTPVKVGSHKPSDKLFAHRVAFGDEEVRQLKLLEKEARLLKAQLKVVPEPHFKHIPVVERELRLKEFLTRFKSPLTEMKDLKVMEKEIKGVKTVQHVVLVGPTTSMLSPPLPAPLPPKWVLKPKGIFKEILAFEEQIDAHDYVNAIDHYLLLNRALQEDTTLSPEEQKEAFMRLLLDYKRVRDIFFNPK